MCASSSTSTANLGHVQPRILCVDDSQEILEICRTVLEASKYQVFTASNGAGALEFLQLQSVDAAVIDNMMPGMNGIDLAEYIKGFNDRVRVILFSGTLRGDERFPFVDACLPKANGPIALRNLLGALLHE